MKNNKVGRRTVMTQETIDKLEAAFAVGATDAQAAFNAGIHVDTFYKWQREHPEFIARKMGLKGQTAYIAKQTVNKGVKHNPDLALKVLERVEKDTYSLRTEYSGLNGQPIEITIKGLD